MWSSYRATAGEVAAPDWLDADWVLGQLGGHNPKVAYEHFVAQGLRKRPCLHVAAREQAGGLRYQPHGRMRTTLLTS
jgi:hypothetical protein